MFHLFSLDFKRSRKIRKPEVLNLCLLVYSFVMFHVVRGPTQKVFLEPVCWCGAGAGGVLGRRALTPRQRRASAACVSCRKHLNVRFCAQEADVLVAAILPADKAAAASEIAVYLKESVGNPTRIDYGTGN